MQALIEYIEVKSIEYPETDLPKVEVCARIFLPKGTIRTIHKERIAEAIQDACANNVEIEPND